MEKILILGGTGFVGRSLARVLAQAGHTVTVPSRQPPASGPTTPGVQVVKADIHQPEVLDRLIADHSRVVNLVGILHGDFETAHVRLPQAVAQACARHGVQRLIHMSALAAHAQGPSQYLRSRGRGEDAVRTVSAQTGLPVTIFRPSVIFGEDDRFINTFAQLARQFPVIPLGSPHATFQVVWVEDVARALALSLDRPEAAGQTYELVGPQVYTLRQLMDIAMRRAGVRRWVIELGPTLSQWQAAFFECLPGEPIMTRDNVASMQVPNVAQAPFPACFGQAARLETVMLKA